MLLFRRIKRILPFVVIEMICAVYLLSRCFVSMADIRVDGEAFFDNIKDKTNAEYIENLGVVFVPKNGSPDTEVYSFEMPLRSGGYEVVVDYESEGVDEGNFEGVYYPVTDHPVTGEVSLVSVHTSAIDMSEVLLTSSKKTASGRGYIRFGRTVPDVQLKISYSNLGRLTVKSIHIKQSRSYQFIRLLSFLLFSVVLDLLAFLFLELLDGRGMQIYGKYKSVFFIVGITCILSAPFFNNHIISGYDLRSHLMRISHVARELSYGQFPVRIYRDALDGYGYPNPIFYCDIFLYIPAVLYALFLPLRTAYNVYVILVNLLTVTSAFYSCRTMCRDNRISAAATIMYSMCEWRIGRVVKGAAVGGYTAFIFFPLIVAGIYNIYTKETPEKKDRLILAAGMAGLASCHILSLEITVIFLVIFAVLEWKKTFKRKIFFSLCIAAVEALLFCMYFIVPFIVSYIKLPLKVKMGESYIQSRGMDFIQFIQFFYAGENVRGDVGQKSLAFGAGMLIALALILYCIFISSKRDEREDRYCLGIIAGMTVLSAFMSSSSFPLDMIYDNMPGFFAPVYYLLSSIQFPVRYMCITVSLLTVGTCVGLKYLKNNRKDMYKVFVWFLCIGSITEYSVYIGYINNHSTVEKYTASDSNMEQEIMGGEYLPDFYSWKITKNTDIRTEDEIKIDQIERKNGDLYFNAINMTGKDVKVSLPIFDYGNYKAIGADNIRFNTESDEDYRLCVIIHDGYSGKIRIHYSEPVLWRLCEIISLFSILTTLFFVKDRKREIKDAS